jgi:hypothetical protein
MIQLHSSHLQCFVAGRVDRGARAEPVVNANDIARQAIERIARMHELEAEALDRAPDMRFAHRIMTSATAERRSRRTEQPGMEMTCTRPAMRASFPPTSELAVAAFERSIGRRLPEPYRAFLVDCNGGSPVKCLFGIPDWGETVVDCFHGLATGHRTYDLDWVNERSKFHLPDGVLSIATDPGGVDICISLVEKGLGKVFLADTSGRYQDLLRVAPDFQAFLDMLVDPDAGTA